MEEEGSKNWEALIETLSGEKRLKNTKEPYYYLHFLSCTRSSYVLEEI